MGSAAWADQVFTSPPVVNLRGHSKRTQCHLFASSVFNAIITVQGRNELWSALALEHLVRVGIFRRAKPQPFKTDANEFGLAIRPDFLAEAVQKSESTYYVVETKSARFLTRKKTMELEDIRERFAKFNMRYVVWTDAFPLSRPTRQHLLLMRQAETMHFSTDTMKKISQWVSESPDTTLRSFYSNGFDLADLYCAAVRALIHFRINAPLTPASVLTAKVQGELWQIFTGSSNNLEGWWDSLPA